MLQALKGLMEGMLSLFQVRASNKSEERRRLIRLRCDYTVQCVVEDQQFEARVVDMGLNGMRLCLDARLKPGNTVFVYHPAQADRTENEYVLCVVRWSRRRRDSELMEAGLQYADTPGNMRRSWVKFLLKELGFDERAIYTRRKSIRADAALTAQVVADDGRRWSGRLVNLGAGGALFEADEAVPAHTKVRLHIASWSRLKALELPALALHSKTEQGKALTSLRFDELRPTQVKLLGNYVLQLLRATSV